MPDLDVTNWFGIFAPKGLPEPMQKRFNSALNGALNDPEVKQKLQDLAMELFPTSLEQAKSEVARSSAYRQKVANTPGSGEVLGQAVRAVPAAAVGGARAVRACFGAGVCKRSAGPRGVGQRLAHPARNAIEKPGDAILLDWLFEACGGTEVSQRVLVTNPAVLYGWQF